MEKMKYERPVMRAELFQTAAYCISSCDDKGQGHLTGMSSLTLSKSTQWFSISNPFWSNQIVQTIGSILGVSLSAIGDSVRNNAAYQDYGSLTFGGTQIPTNNNTQYYWQTTVGGNTYYLEYTNNYNEIWQREGGKASDMFFILHMEEGANASANANRLDSAVNSQSQGWLGTDYDHESHGWYPFVGSFDADEYDDAIMGVVFSAEQVNTYWS